MRERSDLAPADGIGGLGAVLMARSCIRVLALVTEKGSRKLETGEEPPSPWPSRDPCWTAGTREWNRSLSVPQSPPTREPAKTPIRVDPLEDQYPQPWNSVRTGQRQPGTTSSPSITSSGPRMRTLSRER